MSLFAPYFRRRNGPNAPKRAYELNGNRMCCGSIDVSKKAEKERLEKLEKANEIEAEVEAERQKRLDDSSLKRTKGKR